jgi:DNA-damage-inducible protein D
MTDLELIFNMLGERVTTEITRVKDAKVLPALKVAANEGGGVAGRARRDAEKKIGKTVISEDDYLDEPESVKRKRLK